MDTIEETRRKRLLLLIEEFGSAAKLADVIQVSQTQISHWKNRTPDYKTGKPRAMDSITARNAEVLTKKPVGWMDQPVISADEEFKNALLVIQRTPIEKIAKNRNDDIEGSDAIRESNKRESSKK